MYAAYGPQQTSIESWDDWAGYWNTGKGVWGSRTRTPLDDTVISISPEDSSMKVLDPIDPSDAGEIKTVIERTDFPMEDHRQVTTITRVYPHIEGTEPLSIRFGSQDYPGSPVRWKAPVIFDPDTDRKVDVRTTGELHCWKIESIGKGHWTFSGMDIEYALSGAR